MARLAILLRDGELTETQLRLGHILDFFGVPWKTAEVSNSTDLGKISNDHVVFGSARAVADVLQQARQMNRSGPRPAAYYTYVGDDWNDSERAFQYLCDDANASLLRAPAGNFELRVSREMGALTGPMTGLAVLTALRKEDALLSWPGASTARFTTLLSAGDAPGFIRLATGGAPVFFCGSSRMIDIEQLASQGFYDVKSDFCSVVPLVMFLQYMFSEVAWRPQELSACLIIDDPLLKRRYGCCDFEKLRGLMLEHGFTTNIAFIPWNWRRTSRAASAFFRTETRHFSVSIHGCDHVAAEFGATLPEDLIRRAKLAQSRMRNHEARTGIHHDPIMIFPQGIFSSACPDVLKRNGFLAAVNTEVAPAGGSQTRIRDVWDMAIMAYGDFPIFTRRYVSHGLENFAFDILLGKPCLIVSHHECFKDGGQELIEFIEKLRSLNCPLRWRPLGDVIRSACRRRFTGSGVEEAEMYGNELVVQNPSEQRIDVCLRKRESDASLVSEVRCNRRAIPWTAGSNHVVFAEKVGPRSEAHFQVLYREPDGFDQPATPGPFEMSVAARRLLSEFRDDYLSKSRFLTRSAATLKHVFTKAS